MQEIINIHLDSGSDGTSAVYNVVNITNVTKEDITHHIINSRKSIIDLFFATIQKLAPFLVEKAR